MTASAPFSRGSAVKPRSRGGPILIGALVVDSIGGGLFLPLGLIYFTRVTDVPLTKVGILLSVANLLQFPIPLLAGFLADRFGALPFVILAQGLQAAGNLTAGFVRGPVGIFVAATLLAVGVRLFWSTVFTAIADYVDGSTRRRTKDYWYAWAGMSRTAGLGFGGLITGLVIAGPGTDPATLRRIAFAAALCYVIAAVTIVVAVRAPHARADSEPEKLAGYGPLLRDRPYLGFTLVNAVFALSSMMLPLALPTVVLTQLRGPTWLVSGVLVGNTIIVSVVTAPIIGRLRPFRRTRLLVTAATLWTVWALIMATLHGSSAGVVVTLVVASLFFCSASVIQG